MNSLAMTKLMSPQAGKVKNCEHHVLDDAEVDGREALDGTDAHDGAGLDVCGGHGDAGKGGKQQVRGAREVGGEALILLELNHALADGLDDALTAHAGADTHGGRAQQHNPDGDAGIADAGLAVCEGHA